jgi:hypothetical protein
MVQTRLQTHQSDIVPQIVPDPVAEEQNGYDTTTTPPTDEAEAAADVITDSVITANDDADLQESQDGAVVEDFDDALEFASAYYDADAMAVLNPFAKVCGVVVSYSFCLLHCVLSV